MDTPQQTSQTSYKGSSFIVIAVTIAVVITGSIIYWYMDQDQELFTPSSMMQVPLIKQEPIFIPQIEEFGSEFFEKATNPLFNKLQKEDNIPIQDTLTIEKL